MNVLHKGLLLQDWVFRLGAYPDFFETDINFDITEDRANSEMRMAKILEAIIESCLLNE